MKRSSSKILVKSIACVALYMCAFGAFAAEMEQIAYGIKWTYLVSNGKALITSNTKWVKHPKSPVAIKIPQTLGGCPVEKIRKDGLRNLSSGYVRQLIIPEGVTSIQGSLGLGGNYSEITSISLPKTLRVIGPEAFGGTFQGTQLTLPEGLESIGTKAFEGCKKMTSISIPESVKELGSDAFAKCSAIKTANIPKQIKVVPRGLFSDTELETITLHDDITEIGDYAFYSTKLKEVKMPSKLKKIGDSAFCSAKQLEQIEVPNGVTSIGREAFSRCEALEIVMIPNSVTTIGDGSFSICKNITSVTIPARFKSEILRIFGLTSEDRMFESFAGIELGESVPPSDVFTFTESPTSGPGRGDGESVGEDDKGDKAISWVGNMCKKLWNNHRTGVCVVAGILVLVFIMGMCAEMCADKKSKDVDEEEDADEEEDVDEEGNTDEEEDVEEEEDTDEEEDAD